MSYSLEGWRILREAKKQGYQPVKGAEQQLPLTLILDRWLSNVQSEAAAESGLGPGDAGFAGLVEKKIGEVALYFGRDCAPAAAPAPEENGERLW